MQSTISVDWTDANLDGTFAAGERTGSVEYLIENANFTGYQQTILEVTKNAAGQATKRISYTFGTDEITQTVSTLNASTGAVTATQTQAFGHDGRGSVQVLFDAAAAIAQVYTYSAYGELLAIHNGAAAVVGTIGQANLESLAATNKLYNGEGFDTRTGLYNFRARNYSASLGRFERLDPFSGNLTDPFSFNKYGFVHGNPVMGTDPTGLFFGGGFGGLSISVGLQIGLTTAAIGAAIGGVYGGIRGAIDTYLDPDATWQDVIFNSAESAIQGAAFGALFGALGAYSLVLGGIAGGVSLLLGTYQNYDGIKQSFQQGNEAQGYFRTVMLMLDLVLGVIAYKGVTGAKSQPLAPGQTPPAGTGNLGGRVVDAPVFAIFKYVMTKYGRTDFEAVPIGQPIQGNANAGAAYQATPGGRSKIYHRENMTYAEMIHEFFHFMDHKARGNDYFDPSRAGLARRETFVWARLKETFWSFMNEAERANADAQMGRFISGTNASGGLGP